MKSLVLSVDRNTWESTTGYTLESVADPELNEKTNPADAEAALIEPIYAGVCGTDKGIWYRKAFRDPILKFLEKDGVGYRIAGHEMVGRITALGSKAEARSSYKIGDIVSAESHLYCGICNACLVGNFHVCENERIIGVTADGVFAERTKLPVNVLWPTDIEKICPEIAAIQEPFGNAVHACIPFDGSDLRGCSVVVFGCGTIGLFSILIAQELGARQIIGVEPNPKNQKLAKACGADIVLEPSEVNPKTIQSLTGGTGADYCLEMSGHPISLQNAIKVSGNGSHIVLFGLSTSDLVVPNFQSFILQGKSIHAVIGRKIFTTWKRAKKLLEDKSNGIQEKIWKVILEEGKGSIVNLKDFRADDWEDRMQRYAKILVKIS